MTIALDYCPHCGGDLLGSEDQVAAWRIICLERCFPLADDRVSEATAAQLLGVSVKWLARRRKIGCGPQWSAIPVAGSRFSYSLQALSQFKSAHTNGEDWT